MPDGAAVVYAEASAYLRTPALLHTLMPAGRSGRRWERLKAEVRSRGSRCCRCGQSIDYSLAWPDPGSFSVDHYPHPLSTHRHLAEDLSNLAAAHLDCNQSAGDRGVKPNLGNNSESW